jgi:hypothetical protein
MERWQSGGGFTLGVQRCVQCSDAWSVAMRAVQRCVESSDALIYSSNCGLSVCVQDTSAAMGSVALQQGFDSLTSDLEFRLEIYN